jgi:tetratricopeptide (TPR) repeat protein
MRRLSLIFALSLALMAPVGAQTDPQIQRLRQQVEARPQVAAPYFQLAERLLVVLREDWGRRNNEPRPLSVEEGAVFTQRANELIALYRQGLDLEPQNMDALLQLAETYSIFLGQVPEAEVLLMRGYELRPDYPPLLVTLAEFRYFQLGQRTEALELLRKAHGAQPQSPELAMTLADLLTYEAVDAAPFQEALKALETTLQKQPGQEAIHMMLGRVRVREASRDELKLDTLALDAAIAVFGKILQANPKQEEARLELARAYRLRGDGGAAEREARALRAQAPLNPEGLLLLGDILLESQAKALDQGQFPSAVKEAEQVYRQIIDQQLVSRLPISQQVQLYYNLGLLAHVEGNQLVTTAPAQAIERQKSAIQAWEQTSRLFDAISVLNSSVQGDLGRAYRALAQLRQGAEALSLYQKGCAFKDPDSCEWLKKNGHGV